MTADIWKGKWKQLKGDLQKQWGKLTDDDLDKVQGDRTKLEGLLQERHGVEKKDAKAKLDEIEKKYSARVIYRIF